MKRRIKWLFLLIAVVCMAVSGCESGNKTEEKGYTIYRLTMDGNGITEEKYLPENEENTDELVNELLDQFTADEEGSISALPAGVSVNGVKQTGDVLMVDFSETFYESTGVDTALLKATLVKTLVQVPGVNRVQFTVEGKLYVDKNGNVTGGMDGSEFIDSRGEGINAYQYATLNLYFPDAEGEKLIKEARNVYYSTNIIPERVVLEQLLDGPQNTKLQRSLTEGVGIINIQIQDKLCIIDLDNEFNTVPSGTVTPEAAIYSVVNSICDSCQVTKVLFKIDGKEDAMFRDAFVLDQVYEWNAEMLAAGTEESSAEQENQKGGESVLVGIDPSLEGE